jgi:hypothetical protein
MGRGGATTLIVDMGAAFFNLIFRIPTDKKGKRLKGEEGKGKRLSQFAL